MLTFNLQDRVAEILIDRASAGNAVTSEMVRRFIDILAEASGKADIVSLKGAGDDFTIGRDRHEPKSASAFDTFRTIGRLNRALAEFPGIVLAGVRGRAFGLGVGLVMRSDIAIAAESARFGLDEVAHGIPPMFIMEEMIEHLPPKRALDLVLSGRTFGAQEAFHMGLVSRVVADAELDAAIGAFISDLKARDREVVLACKRYMRAARKLPIEARPDFALLQQTEFATAKR